MKAIAVDRRNQCLDWGGAAKTLKHNAETGDNNPVALIMDNAIAIDNDSLRMGEATRTLTGDHESRVTDTGTSIVQTFCKTGHAVNAQGDGEKYASSSSSSTLNTFENHTDGRAVDAYNQATTGGASKPLGHSATDTDHTPAVALNHIVRRLTPVECERLQGFPDGWTRIPYRGKPAEQCPDSPRYKALGNSWATNCAEYILRRIVAAFQLDMI